MSRSFDVKCFELAKIFMDDLPMGPNETPEFRAQSINDLASDIQQTIEDYTFSYGLLVSPKEEPTEEGGEGGKEGNN